MEEKNNFNSIGKLIQSAKSVIVALPPDPSMDLISAGVSLHLSLIESGKKSQLGCGTHINVSEKIAGIQEITDSIGAKNLVISFDYREDDLEKVDYDVNSDGKFFLLVKPKSGAPVPDVSNVKYSYSGAEADLVITMGIYSLEELGKIYADEKKFLDEATVVSLNTSPRPAGFTENQLHRNISSFSELIAILLEKSRLKPGANAANNLLNSVYDETQSLTSSRLTADTFSAISFLMRSGAKLPHQKTFVSGLAPGARQTPAQPPFFEVPAHPAKPQADSEPEFEDDIPVPEEDSPIDVNQPIPKDWTKPKIFRAGDA